MAEAGRFRESSSTWNGDPENCKGTAQAATRRHCFSTSTRHLNKATMEIIFGEPRHIHTGAGPLLSMLSWTSQLEEESRHIWGVLSFGSGSICLSSSHIVIWLAPGLLAPPVLLHLGLNCTEGLVTQQRKKQTGKMAQQGRKRLAVPPGGRKEARRVLALFCCDCWFYLSLFPCSPGWPPNHYGAEDDWISEPPASSPRVLGLQR